MPFGKLVTLAMLTAFSVDAGYSYGAGEGSCGADQAESRSHH